MSDDNNTAFTTRARETRQTRPARPKPNGFNWRGDGDDYTSSSPAPRGAKWRTVKTFTYCDAHGNPAFEVIRQTAYKGSINRSVVDEKTGKVKKRCFQKWLHASGGYKPNDAPVLLYRLPELMAAVKAGRTIFIPEGEPKVEALREWGLAATCNPEGALTHAWKPEHAEFLRGADVVILPDNDDPGRAHADQVGRSLEGLAKRRRLLELPVADHRDIVDWVQDGGTREQFLELVKQAREWEAYGPEAPPVQSDKVDDRAVITLINNREHDAATAAENALVTTGKVYRQDIQLVRFVYEDADASKGRKTTVACIRPYNPALLWRELLEVARCAGFNAKGEPVISKSSRQPADDGAIYG